MNDIVKIALIPALMFLGADAMEYTTLPKVLEKLKDRFTKA